MRCRITRVCVCVCVCFCWTNIMWPELLWVGAGTASTEGGGCGRRCSPRGRPGVLHLTSGSCFDWIGMGFQELGRDTREAEGQYMHVWRSTGVAWRDVGVRGGVVRRGVSAGVGLRGLGPGR